MASFRWGIIGPGHIARDFAQDIRWVEDGVIAAVASRQPERAAAFAADFAIPTIHPHYQALIDDDSLDAIYVATPHPMHADVTIAALRAGRAVLCEKPLAPTMTSAAAMIAAAHDSGVFLMEGMWTRCLPLYAEIKAWISAGRIGEPRLVQGSYGLQVGNKPGSRLLDPALAGGGLLDVGVYPIALSQWIFKTAASEVRALGRVAANGIDEQCGVLIAYPGGGLAMVSAAVQTRLNAEAWIYGSEASIRIPAPCWAGDQAELIRGGVVIDTIATTRHKPSRGFQYQIAEVQRCVRAGLQESPQMPHADSLEVLRICDLARAQMGVRYPFETAV